MILVSMILVLLVSISNVNGYLIGPNVMSWADAEAYCVAQGSHLATICNDAERDRAKALCSANDDSSGRGCWIGLYEETMNVWKWADGSALGYGFDANSLPTTGMNPWHPGEPNNHGGQPEDCIHLFDGQTFNWNDAICNDNNLPLCNDPEADIEYEMCNYDANTETVPNSGVGSYSDLDLSKGIADGFASVGTSIEGYDEVCFDIQSTNSQAECVRIPINVDYNAIPNLSYELYLKQGAIENNFGWIMSQDDGAYDRSILMHDWRYDPAGETYGLAAGTGSPYVGSAPLPANVYKHLVVVFEGGAGGTAKIYVDGVLVSTDVVALNSVSRYDYICLNTNPGHNGHGWNGCMSEVRIYKRALTQEQVTSLAQGAPSGKCDYAPPDDECERGVNYEITGRTCIAWGDPHFTTFNGDIHDFQGQMNSGRRRFYYVTPCADYCYDDMPFSIIGNHFSWGGRQVSGVDYLTLELYESNAEIYSVYISGSILEYALNANGDDYDQADANGILNPVGASGRLFGTRFLFSYTKPNAKSIKVVLTIDGQCTVKFNMYGQYYFVDRWRMHRMEILPLDCYQCMACGLCGGYKLQRGAYQLETCNGGSVPFSRGWGPNNAFAWDLYGNTWEKGYRDSECPICATVEDPNDNYAPNITDFNVEEPCDPDIEPQVIDACQAARDALDNAGDCCDVDFCNEQQDACEFDACVAADGDISAIDDAVQQLFTDNVEGICNDPTVEPTLDPTNSEGEGSGCTQASDCGNNAICNNPGPNGRCSCEDGYRGDPDSGIDCTDIDECGEENPCPEVCTNEDGGVSCACNNPIFDVNGDGSECVEPPYVVAGPLDCQAAQEYCKNTFGTQLATIRTAEDRTNAINALTDAGKEYGWIGLYSDDVETKWQFRSGATCPSASAYKCVDFWLESFKDGGAYRPRCIGPTENGYGCAVFYRDDNGVNNDKDVTDPIPFLCDE